MIGYVHSLIHPHQTIHTPAQYIHVAIASEFSKIGQELGSQCTFYCFKKKQSLIENREFALQSLALYD